MQTQTKFCVCFTKTNIKLFSGAPKLLLIIKVGPSPNIKKLFLRLSEWHDELLLTPKIITFLAKSSTKLHEPAISNIIPYPLYRYFSLSLFLIILVAPNKQFLNLKLLEDFLAKYIIHRQCIHLYSFG